MASVRAQRPLVEDVFLLPAVRKDVNAYQPKLSDQWLDTISKAGPLIKRPVFLWNIQYVASD